MTVKQDDYGRGKRPAWKWEDLASATHAVLTILAVDPKAEIPDEDTESGTRTVLTMTFEEDNGEKTLYTNYRQVGYLIERLGSNEKKWPGQQVVIKKVRQPFGKQEYKKVAVAPPEEWDEALAKAKSRRGAKARR